MRWEEILEVGWPLFASLGVLILLKVIAPDILPYIKYILAWIIVIAIPTIILLIIIMPVILLLIEHLSTKN